MSDDDYRPLKTVSEDIFIHNDRYKSYYFYDLDQWHSAETDFDSVQHNVAGALDYLGMPRLAFASHMPQIVKRDWYLESVEEFEKLGGDLDICEWSAYFNYSIKTHPDSFTEPEPYLTMCWPDHPDSWPMYVTPKEHWFENFYPESYVPSGPFHGMRTICEDKQSQERANLEKLNRWRLYIAKSRNARTDLRRFPERQLRKALRSTLIDLKSQVFYSRRKT